mgnify:CR=1 FL=1
MEKYIANAAAGCIIVLIFMRCVRVGVLLHHVVLLHDPVKNVIRRLISSSVFIQALCRLTVATPPMEEIEWRPYPVWFGTFLCISPPLALR